MPDKSSPDGESTMTLAELRAHEAIIEAGCDHMTHAQFQRIMLAVCDGEDLATVLDEPLFSEPL